MRLKELYFMTLLLIMNSCSPFSVGDHTVDLGNGFLFISESNANQYVIHELDINHYTIPPTVEDYAFDSSYIVARQKEDDKRAGNDLGNARRKYWIVSKNRGTIYGPLDSLNFVRKQQELSIRLSMTSNY